MNMMEGGSPEKRELRKRKNIVAADNDISDEKKKIKMLRSPTVILTDCMSVLDSNGISSGNVLKNMSHESRVSVVRGRTAAASPKRSGGSASTSVVNNQVEKAAQVKSTVGSSDAGEILSNSLDNTPDSTCSSNTPVKSPVTKDDTLKALRQYTFKLRTKNVSSTGQADNSQSERLKSCKSSVNLTDTGPPGSVSSSLSNKPGHSESVASSVSNKPGNVASSLTNKPGNVTYSVTNKPETVASSVSNKPSHSTQTAIPKARTKEMACSSVLPQATAVCMAMKLYNSDLRKSQEQVTALLSSVKTKEGNHCGRIPLSTVMAMKIVDELIAAPSDLKGVWNGLQLSLSWSYKSKGYIDGFVIMESKDDKTWKDCRNIGKTWRKTSFTYFWQEEKKDWYIGIRAYSGTSYSETTKLNLATLPRPDTLPGDLLNGVLSKRKLYVNNSKSCCWSYMSYRINPHTPGRPSQKVIKDTSMNKKIKHLPHSKTVPSFYDVLCSPVNCAPLPELIEGSRKGDTQIIEFIFSIDQTLSGMLLASREHVVDCDRFRVKARMYEMKPADVSHQEGEIPDCIISVNSKIIHVQRSNQHRGSLDITDYCQFSKFSPSENALNIEWMPDTKRYCLTVSVVKMLDIEGVVSKLMQSNIRSASITVNMIKNILKSDNGLDSDISYTSIKTQLTCPLGKSRIVTPCRGSYCTHLYCMDALTLLKLNEKRPLSKKKCFMCDKPLEFIYVDGLFLNILQCVPETVNEVAFDNDGSWSYSDPKHTDNDKITEKSVYCEPSVQNSPLKNITGQGDIQTANATKKESDSFLTSQLKKVKLQLDRLSSLTTNPINDAVTEGEHTSVDGDLVDISNDGEEIVTDIIDLTDEAADNVYIDLDDKSGILDKVYSLDDIYSLPDVVPDIETSKLTPGGYKDGSLTRRVGKNIHTSSKDNAVAGSSAAFAGSSAAVAGSLATRHSKNFHTSSKDNAVAGSSAATAGSSATNAGSSAAIAGSSAAIAGSSATRQSSNLKTFHSVNKNDPSAELTTKKLARKEFEWHTVRMLPMRELGGKTPDNPVATADPPAIRQESKRLETSDTNVDSPTRLDTSDTNVDSPTRRRSKRLHAPNTNDVTTSTSSPITQQGSKKSRTQDTDEVNVGYTTWKQSKIFDSPDATVASATRRLCSIRSNTLNQNEEMADSPKDVGGSKRPHSSDKDDAAAGLPSKIPSIQNARNPEENSASSTLVNQDTLGSLIDTDVAKISASENLEQVNDKEDVEIISVSIHKPKHYVIPKESYDDALELEISRLLKQSKQTHALSTKSIKKRKRDKKDKGVNKNASEKEASVMEDRQSLKGSKSDEEEKRINEKTCRKEPSVREDRQSAKGPNNDKNGKCVNERTRRKKADVMEDSPNETNTEKGTKSKKLKIKNVDIDATRRITKSRNNAEEAETTPTRLEQNTLSSKKRMLNKLEQITNKSTENKPTTRRSNRISTKTVNAKYKDDESSGTCIGAGVISNNDGQMCSNLTDVQTNDDTEVATETGETDDSLNTKEIYGRDLDIAKTDVLEDSNVGDVIANSDIVGNSDVIENNDVNDKSEVIAHNDIITDESQVITNTDVTDKSEVITNTDVTDKSEVITNTDVTDKSEVITNTDVTNKSEVIANTDVNDKSEVITNTDVNDKSDIFANNEATDESEVIDNSTIHDCSGALNGSDNVHDGEVSDSVSILDCSSIFGDSNAMDEIEVINNESEVIDNESEVIDKESEAIDNDIKVIGESEVIDVSESEVIDNENEVIDNESEAIDNDNEVIDDSESEVIDGDSEVIDDSESEVIDIVDNVPSPSVTHPHVKTPSSCNYDKYKTKKLLSSEKKSKTLQRIVPFVVDCNDTEELPMSHPEKKYRRKRPSKYGLETKSKNVSKFVPFIVDCGASANVNIIESDTESVEVMYDSSIADFVSVETSSIDLNLVETPEGLSESLSTPCDENIDTGVNNVVETGVETDSVISDKAEDDVVLKPTISLVESKTETQRVTSEGSQLAANLSKVSVNITSVENAQADYEVTREVENMTASGNHALGGSEVKKEVENITLSGDHARGSSEEVENKRISRENSWGSSEATTEGVDEELSDSSDIHMGDITGSQTTGKRGKQRSTKFQRDQQTCLGGLPPSLVKTDYQFIKKKPALAPATRKQMLLMESGLIPDNSWRRHSKSRRAMKISECPRFFTSPGLELKSQKLQKVFQSSLPSLSTVPAKAVGDEQQTTRRSSTESLDSDIIEIELDTSSVKQVTTGDLDRTEQIDNKGGINLLNDAEKSHQITAQCETMQVKEEKSTVDVSPIRKSSRKSNNERFKEIMESVKPNKRNNSNT